MIVTAKPPAKRRLPPREPVRINGSCIVTYVPSTREERYARAAERASPEGKAAGKAWLDRQLEKARERD